MKKFLLVTLTCLLFVPALVRAESEDDPESIQKEFDRQMQELDKQLKQMDATMGGDLQLSADQASSESSQTMVADQVVAELIRQKYITSGTGIMKNDGNVKVWMVDGVSEQKLLWLFPVKIKKNITVDVATGKVLKVSENFGNKLLDWLSA
jgi:hypothetical protein